MFNNENSTRQRDLRYEFSKSQVVAVLSRVASAVDDAVVVVAAAAAAAAAAASVVAYDAVAAAAAFDFVVAVAVAVAVAVELPISLHAWLLSDFLLPPPLLVPPPLRLDHQHHLQCPPLDDFDHHYEPAQ
jgi:hypothetical protein